MPRRVGCDVSVFDGREKKKKKNGRTEWMNEWMLTLFGRRLCFFFVSFSLSFNGLFFLLLLSILCPLFRPIRRFHLSVLSLSLASVFFFFFFVVSHLLWRLEKWRYVFFANSWSHLTAKRKKMFFSLFLSFFLLVRFYLCNLYACIEGWR